MKKECTQAQLKELKALGYTGGNTIGDFIEFLGDDWIGLYNETFSAMVVEDYMPVEEMCDHLWEACKNKLNN